MVSNNLQLSLALFWEFFLPVLNGPREDTRPGLVGLGAVRFACAETMGRFSFFWFYSETNGWDTVMCGCCTGRFLRRFLVYNRRLFLVNFGRRPMNLIDAKNSKNISYCFYLVDIRMRNDVEESSWTKTIIEERKPFCSTSKLKSWRRRCPSRFAISATTVFEDSAFTTWCDWTNSWSKNTPSYMFLPLQKYYSMYEVLLEKPTYSVFQKHLLFFKSYKPTPLGNIISE